MTSGSAWNESPPWVGEPSSDSVDSRLPTVISAAASRLAVGRSGADRIVAGGLRDPATEHHVTDDRSSSSPHRVARPRVSRGGSGPGPAAGAGRRRSAPARWRPPPSPARSPRRPSSSRTSSSRSSAAVPAAAVRTSARPPPGCSRLGPAHRQIGVAGRAGTRSRATSVGTSATVRVACTASTNGTVAAGVGGGVGRRWRGVAAGGVASASRTWRSRASAWTGPVPVVASVQAASAVSPSSPARSRARLIRPA